MIDPDQLEQIAAQLAGRVRDDDPEANARWLTAALPDPADWFRLAFALAAAVPDDRSWASLTHWATVGMSECGGRTSVSPLDENRVDEIAIERACHGEKVKLTRAERAAAVDKLTKRGMSRVAIAERLGVTDRTASRWRARNAQ